MYSELGRIRKHKEKKKERSSEKMLIAVAGCVGQAEGKEIFRRSPYVDIVIGPQSIQSLPDLLSKVKRDNGHAINLDFPEHAKFDSLPPPSQDPLPSVFLSIQEGCDKFCSFCVVPYTRGAEFSRPVPDIYREAQKLVAGGAKEITLLGQNVNGYHGDNGNGQILDLGQLIEHLASLDGLARIRYSTSHPRDMHESLYRAHKEIDSLMPFIHLPVQSGSNRILQKMNRKHTRDEYFRIIDRLREGRSNTQFSSDFIVGFPGETDKDFKDTMDLVRHVHFAQAYSFKYSPRPGTPAAEIQDPVPEHVKDERLRALQALLVEQQRQTNDQTIGSTQQVLFEKSGRKDGQIIGKSPYLQSVHVVGDVSLIGQVHPVRILKNKAFSLEGELLEKTSSN
jgi:tRNA-2-methylthio-N6-dimethylallyladenosine synthase